MARQPICICWFECRVLVFAVLHDPVVEPCGDEFQVHRLVAFVLPEPAMDARARRDERAVRFGLARLVVEIVAFVVVRALLARGLYVWLAVKLIEQRRTGGP